jgi:hypothetical protein
MYYMYGTASAIPYRVFYVLCTLAARGTLAVGLVIGYGRVVV